ncbi:MAG: DUF1963 domain-containing protein [Verrucomicrobiaceae bacterium]|nr:DUF1963 domain-containing protein [Verrucomicrobiaceae bacterium]
MLYIPASAARQNSFAAKPEDISDQTCLKKHHVNFVKAHTYPSIFTEEVARLNLHSKQSDAWIDQSSAIYMSHPHHQLGGWPDAVQSPEMDKECQLASNGVYVGNEEGYKCEKAQKLMAGAAEWSLLLQFDSDEELDIMWGDCGMVYFWVKREQAKLGDFSGAWLVFQCC